ncbi:MAG: helix-turn-helix domain-containing protein [Clostridia bacterium]
MLNPKFDVEQFANDLRKYFLATNKNFWQVAKKKRTELLQNANLKKILTNDDLRKTIDSLFENNLNLTQTSKNSFLHRNTLSYRLKTIKTGIGLNLKNFGDAVIFKNLILASQEIKVCKK